MLTIQSLSITALEKIIVPVGTYTDRNRLASLFESLPGFDAMRTFETFQAEKGSYWRVLHDAGELLLVGLGDYPDARSVYGALRSFTQTHRKLLDQETGLFLDNGLIPHSSNTVPDRTPAGKRKPVPLNGLIPFTEICVSGVLAGTYQLDQRETAGNPHPLKNLTLVYADSPTDSTALTPDKLLEAARHGEMLADAQKTAMHLINIPSNRKNPVQFAEIIVEMTAELPIDCEIYDEVRLQREGFELLLGVNRGSEHPARFAVLRYNGTSDGDCPHLGLVGKGVTYDTGGLSLKPTAAMVWMKCDMAGAATVLAATLAAARLGLPIQLTTVIPLTDNLVDSRSVKPGDILNSYSGKTVEIADTDAEGRLILADALSWMVRNADPDCIIDLATLTGAAVRALGSQAAALFCNDRELEHLITTSADETGERVWSLPLWDDYNGELHSDVADVRNLSGKPTAGAIAAAKFLEVFTENHPSWAHLDVAGTVFGDTEFGKMKNATGYGVLLLVNVMKHMI